MPTGFTPKKINFIVLCAMYAVLFVLALHRSPDPAIWHWSHLYFFFILYYFLFLALLTVLYILSDKISRGYALFLIVLYFLTVLLGDFMIGTINYSAHEKEMDHPIFHHQLKPGTYHLAIDDDGMLDQKYIMHVNAQGLRSNKDIPYEKPAGHVRILSLGDSFTEGQGVGDEENFCYLVERQLNKESGSPVYEVLNAGVDSYAPILENLYLRTKGINFQPDLVVVFYDMSDLIQTQEYFDGAEFNKDGEVISVPPNDDSLLSNMEVFLKSRFYFLSLVYGAARERVLPDEDPDAISQATEKLLKFSLSSDQSPWKDEWERVFHDIDLMNEFCKQKGIGFAVVIYPWGHQVSGREWDSGRQWFGVPDNYTAPRGVEDMFVYEMERRGIPVLNLFPAFRDHQGGERLYFHEDMHWRKEGHSLAAQYIMEFFMNLSKPERAP